MASITNNKRTNDSDSAPNQKRQLRASKVHTLHAYMRRDVEITLCKAALECNTTLVAQCASELEQSIEHMGGARSCTRSWELAFRLACLALPSHVVVATLQSMYVLYDERGANTMTRAFVVLANAVPSQQSTDNAVFACYMQQQQRQQNNATAAAPPPTAAATITTIYVPTLACEFVHANAAAPPYSVECALVQFYTALMCNSAPAVAVRAAFAVVAAYHEYRVKVRCNRVSDVRGNTFALWIREALGLRRNECKMRQTHEYSVELVLYVLMAQVARARKRDDIVQLARMAITGLLESHVRLVPAPYAFVTALVHALLSAPTPPPPLAGAARMAPIAVATTATTATTFPRPFCILRVTNRGAHYDTRPLLRTILIDYDDLTYEEIDKSHGMPHIVYTGHALPAEELALRLHFGQMPNAATGSLAHGAAKDIGARLRPLHASEWAERFAAVPASLLVDGGDDARERIVWHCTR